LPEAEEMVSRLVGVLTPSDKSGIDCAAGGLDCLGEALVEPAFETAERGIEIL
jgi:hypothetical protein